MIIFTRPFRVGEYIEIVGVNGMVASIDLLSTTLTHVDRSRVVIPNRKIMGEILHNYGTIRQLELSVGVAYSSELGHVLRTLEQVLRMESRVLKEPAPVVGVSALADSSIEISIKPWVKASGLWFNRWSAKPGGYRGLPKGAHRYTLPSARGPLPQRAWC